MTLFVAHKEQFVHLVWNLPCFIITVFSLSSFPIEKFPTENCLRRVSSLANIIPVLKNKAYLANKYYINFLWQSSADSLFLKNWTRTSEYRTLLLWLIFALWDGIQNNILKTGPLYVQFFWLVFWVGSVWLYSTILLHLHCQLHLYC